VFVACTNERVDYAKPQRNNMKDRMITCRQENDLMLWCVGWKGCFCNCVHLQVHWQPVGDGHRPTMSALDGAIPRPTQYRSKRFQHNCVSILCVQIQAPRSTDRSSAAVVGARELLPQCARSEWRWSNGVGPVVFCR